MKRILLDLNEKISASQAWDYEFGILLKQNTNEFIDRDLAKRFEQLSAAVVPPSNNMGGNLFDTPLFLPRCEISAARQCQKTKIDALGFTSLAGVDELKALLTCFWPDVVFSSHSKGIQGYPKCYVVSVDGEHYGLLGYGAAHGRNYVSLLGTACKSITAELLEVVVEALQLPEISARLQRVDICFDLYRGEVTFEHAQWAYEQGRFKGSKGGRNPQQKLIGVSDGERNMGRTMYVGRRDGAVFGRIYEKGLEVFAKLPEDMRHLSEQRENELGTSVFADSWLRLEAEFKRVSKDAVLPFQMLFERDRYFAGAYPYFAEVLGQHDGLRPARLRSELDVDLQALIFAAKRSYGSLIHSLRELGFSPADVVEHLSSGRNNERLVKSGLLSRIKSILAENASSDPDFDIPF